MIDEQDNAGLIRAALLIFIFAAIGGGFYAASLGRTKVSNELKMTEAYERQAVALEDIAYTLRGGSAPNSPATSCHGR